MSGLKQEYRFQEGEVLLIDKPLDWTSFDVVNKIRATIKHQFGLKKIKVGHAGTLDPRATGLLILCTGKFTKRIEEFQAQQKAYTGTFKFGATTPSFDTETEEEQTFPTDHLTEQVIRDAASTMIGEQLQTAPIFSAKKIDGKPAYISARKGQEVKMRKNMIVIHEFEITKIELPLVEFRIVCGKGTYIRSVANDLGRKLDTGAYLLTLRRTAIGEHRVDDAVDVEDLASHIRSLTPQEA